MRKKRGRLNIIFDILKIIKEHNNTIRPTPLLRYSNLSSQNFKEYFKELINKGFIREEKDKKNRSYITLTDKGYKFLDKYKSILSFIDEFEL